MDEHLEQLVWTLVYAALGMGVFGFTFFIITKVTPFSIRYEIEEDQNTALAVLIGSAFIGLAIIISAAITG